MTDSGQRWLKRMVCLGLGAAVLAIYWPALFHGFISYDDQVYVTSNKDVQQGLTWPSIKWALTTGHAANWHPVTWVSHIMDCQLYGLHPAGHHLTSLLLHATNAILLFLLLHRLTGALWRSALVAALFALHPLRVESVVWISERKDVLSTFFGLLAVGAYVRYAEVAGTPPCPPQLERRQGCGVRSAQRADPTFCKIFYALALVLFALGLMSKPMLVTLPFVLLLLDFWPLGRWEPGTRFPWRLIAEKIPFFLLAAADSAATYLVQNHAGAMTTLERFPLGVRLTGVPVAYMSYIDKSFWPAGLAVFHPHREFGLLEVGGAAALLGVVSVLALRSWRARPYLAVGWFWFLGMLVPTIGLVQVGYQATADRYSYLPSVGLWIMVAWGVRDWVGERRFARTMAALGGGLAVLACMVLTPMQIHYWRNSRALFERAAAVTDHDYLIYYNLGCCAMDQADYPQAMLYFKTALSAGVTNVLWTDRSRAYNDLGYVYLHQGDLTNAVANFESAIGIQPHYPEAHFNLGCAFLDNHQPVEAVRCFQNALAMDPNVAQIHYKLANALLQLGRPAQAITEYSRTLQLRPGMDEAANNLAWLLATCSDRSLRDGARAVALAREASAHTLNQNPRILGTLAAAYSEVGRLSDAVATAQRARQLALAQNNAALAGVLESQARQYQGGQGGTPP